MIGRIKFSGVLRNSPRRLGVALWLVAFAIVVAAAFVPVLRPFAVGGFLLVLVPSAIDSFYGRLLDRVRDKFRARRLLRRHDGQKERSGE